MEKLSLTVFNRRSSWQNKERQFGRSEVDGNFELSWQAVLFLSDVPGKSHFEASAPSMVDFGVR